MKNETEDDRCHRSQRLTSNEMEGYGIGHLNLDDNNDENIFTKLKDVKMTNNLKCLISRIETDIGEMKETLNTLKLNLIQYKQELTDVLKKPWIDAIPEINKQWEKETFYTFKFNNKQRKVILDNLQLKESYIILTIKLINTKETLKFVIHNFLQGDNLFETPNDFLNSENVELYNNIFIKDFFEKNIKEN